MAVVVDTSAIVAMYDADAASHRAVMEILARESDDLIVPAPILAEVDYMLTLRLGHRAVDDFVRSLEEQILRLDSSFQTDIARCRQLLSTYRDLHLGLADASIVALAERLGTQTLFTFDERHFRVVRPQAFSHFILWPADYVSV